MLNRYKKIDIELFSLHFRKKQFFDRFIDCLNQRILSIEKQK